MARSSRNSVGADRVSTTDDIDLGSPIIARLNGVASYTFSNLDGNVDVAYELDIFVQMPSSASGEAPVIRFNGDSGANYNGIQDFQYDATRPAPVNESAITFARAGGWVNSAYLRRWHSHVKIYASTGARRLVSSWGSYEEEPASGTKLTWQGAYYWTNTAANINSITVMSQNGGLMTGIVVLRKILAPGVLVGSDNNIPLVGSLPTVGLYDGMQIDYLADSVNGVVWPLRYVLGEPGPYKWYARGPDELYARDNTQVSTTAAAWVDLGGGSPAITVPLAGDYHFQWGAAMTGNSGINGDAGLMVGGVVTAQNYLIGGGITGGISAWSSGSAFARVPGVAAGSIAKVVYGSESAGNSAYFARRWITAKPVRVG